MSTSKMEKRNARKSKKPNTAQRDPTKSIHHHKSHPCPHPLQPDHTPGEARASKARQETDQERWKKIFDQGNGLPSDQSVDQSVVEQKETASMAATRGMMEGFGGPVRLDQHVADGLDPTLDACCQREVLSNRRQSAMQRTLRRHDVVAMAERRRRNLVKTPTFIGCRCSYDPSSDGGGEYKALIDLRASVQKAEALVTADADAAAGGGYVANGYICGVVNEDGKDNNDGNDSDGDSDGDSDDEFDYLLDEDLPDSQEVKEMEERRRAELEMQMLSREMALQHGYGTHRQLHPVRVLKAAGLGDRSKREPPRAVVLHLVDSESLGSASLDLYLEKLAASDAARGTVFVRSGGRSTMLMDAELARKAFPRLDADRDMPALVAIKDGVAVNVAPKLQGLMNGDRIDERSVRHWLERSGVIVDTAPAMDFLCHIRPEEEALMEYLATKKPQEAERYNCGLPSCAKLYAHEHVGIQTSTQSGMVVPEEAIVTDMGR